MTFPMKGLHSEDYPPNRPRTIDNDGECPSVHVTFLRQKT